MKSDAFETVVANEGGFHLSIVLNIMQLQMKFGTSLKNKKAYELIMWFQNANSLSNVIKEENAKP